MKGFIRKGAVIVVAGMLLTGCGDELKTLTESEEEIIVNYSSGTVGKFNKRKMDGMTAVSLAEESETEEPEESTEEPVKEEAEKPEKPEKPTNSEPTSEPEAPKADLTQAFGIAGVEFKYDGYEIKDSYEESDYFSMAAEEGNTYIVAKYTITNTGSKETVCDVLSRKPIFTLKLNGESGYKNEVTLLPNDLSTYSAGIAPGASAEAVLIFEVPAKMTTAVTSVQIEAEVNGTN